MNLIYFINSIMLGIGLAMDAFSISLTNGLKETKMKISRVVYIASIYGFFQYIMPLIGYFIVNTLSKFFYLFQRLVPYIALFLLLYIGIKMIREAKVEDNEINFSDIKIDNKTLILQGIATSIDAFSVGFNISNYNYIEALICCIIIGIVTFIICIFGIIIGKKFGNIFSKKSSILGGIILIIIGVEIFIKSVLLK